jgi:hypothetical protein
MKESFKKRNLKDNKILVQRGTLSEGLKNVAEYLDLNPEKSIFLHSTVVNEDTLGRRLFYKPSFAHSQILSILPRKTSYPKGVCLYVNKGLRDYLSKVGLAPKENYIYIDRYPTNESYPYYSVSGYFIEYLKTLNSKELGAFKGSNIVSSFISRDDETASNFIQGNLIMNIKEQVKFNSKYYLRKLSEKYNYSIPPGTAFKGIDSLKSAYKKIEAILTSENFDIENTKIWCKFQSQTSGKGSYLFEGFGQNNLNDIRNHILKFSKNLNISKEEVYNEIPLVLEVDVNSIPSEIQIGNIGVEAVIGSNSVTLVGCVSQDSKDGKYIGSIIDSRTKKLSKSAEFAALPFLNAIQIEG